MDWSARLSGVCAYENVVGEQKAKKLMTKIDFGERSRQPIENTRSESERTRKRTRRRAWKAVNILKMGEKNEPVAKPKRGFSASILLKTLAEYLAGEWQKTRIIGRTYFLCVSGLTCDIRHNIDNPIPYGKWESGVGPFSIDDCRSRSLGTIDDSRKQEIGSWK